MAGLAPTIFVLCVLAPWPSHAGDLDLLNVGVRARVGEKRVLGEQHPESFRAVDVVASIRLPWESYSPSGWGVSTRLLGSAGILDGAGKIALVVSAVPVIAFGGQDGRFTADMGAGLALLSKHRYAQQDFGGHLQFALTFGVGVPLYRRVGVGYRFMHYSDAGAYGGDTIGADFHMVELIYRF
jgi:lipid A 3-O-deacylase PagL